MSPAALALPINEQILGRPVGSARPVAPPSIGVESGIIPPDAATEILNRKPGAFAGGVCLTRGELMRRIQYASYQGLPTTSVSYPYVLSDTASATKYRVVFMADICAVVSASAIQAALYAIPPGSLPTRIDGSDPFFLNYNTAVPNRNYGPPARGIRLDGNTGIVNVNNQAPQPGQQFPVVFAGDYFVLPPGWTLMAYDLAGVATAPVAGAYLELRVAYAELDLAESFDW